MNASALEEQQPESQDSAASAAQRPTKRPRFEAAIDAAGLGSPGADVELEPEVIEPTADTPEGIVAVEIERLKEVDKRSLKIKTDTDLLKWWDTMEVSMPCLRLLVKCVHGMMAGSGALELDIGSFKDVVQAKRGRLDPGLVEIELLLKINKSAATLDTSKVKDLGSGWKSHIPKRPDFPVGCFDEEEPGNESDGEMWQ